MAPDDLDLLLQLDPEDLADALLHGEGGSQWGRQWLVHACGLGRMTIHAQCGLA